jgi:phosphosulfolactate phosphohydrolase-like enzyme
VNFKFLKGGFMKNLLTQFFFLSLFFFSLNKTAYSQWSNDPTINNAICIAANHQSSLSIVSDGEGGAIMAWEDERSGKYDIYAQRISASGVVLWAVNGVAICTAANDQTVPNIVSDGEGGAIISWSDFRSSTTADLYAQRINASGAVQWTTNGVPICTATNIQVAVAIISDGEAGAIITWHDKRSGSNDIYAQRINASGAVLWTIDGNVICSATEKQEDPSITSDGAGGAIIVWHDNRNGTNLINEYDIYAQRINASGSVLWATDGISVCSLTGNQRYPVIININVNEVIITWGDFRNSIDSDIFAQRLSIDGMVLWTNNGVRICGAANSQGFPVLAGDGAGGAIITWQDYRSGAYDVYAQRVNISGDIMWVADGVPISTETDAQMSPVIISDGQGGAIITWVDYRSSYQDIYAQRINANGVVLWTENGVDVCTAVKNQYYPSIVRDNDGGVIIAWWDFRNGDYADIYAQQVNADGLLGVVTNMPDVPAPLPESFCLDQNYPNPFNTLTEVSWVIVQPGRVVLKVCDVLGMEVRTLVDEDQSLGTHRITFNAEGLPAGVYFMRIQANNRSEVKKINILK